MNETTTEVPVDVKTCSSCKTSQPLNFFAPSKQTKDKLYAYCRACSCKAGRASHQRVKERVNGKRRALHTTQHGRANALCRGAESRSILKGLLCDLTPTWILERLNKGTCEVTGLPFNLNADGRGMGYKKAFAPSLDRTDSNKGYTQDNVKVVVWSYNAVKGTGSHDEVMQLAKALCNVQ